MSPSDPFRIRAYVADFDRIVAAFRSRSQTARGHLRAHLDLAYGPDETERLDIFMPAGLCAARPVHIFVHGGYWRMFSKDDFSFVAETIVNAGAIAVIVDYALMPKVRLEVLVDQVRRARQWVEQHIGDYGGDPGRVTVSGHSAGAHLCCWLFDRSREPGVKAALLLGGLYDLEPLQSSFLKQEIALTDSEVRRWTPLGAAFRSEVEVTLLVGEAETPPFHRQAADFAERLSSQGLPVHRQALLGANHMSSALDLGSPASAAGAWLTRTIIHS